MDFIKIPYLPKKRTTLYIADCNIENAVVIRPPEICSLPPSMRRHADLGFCLISENEAVCPPSAADYYERELDGYGFRIIRGKSEIGCNYPKDCAYNVGIANGVCFMNTKICDEILLNSLKERDYKIVNVNQGYAKCSMCPISEDTILTSDISIKKGAEKNGFKVIFTQTDFVRLGGFPYGFIGGAVSMADKCTLLVNGDGSHLPFLSKLSKAGISVSSIRQGEIVDIGSLIPLMTT